MTKDEAIRIINKHFPSSSCGEYEELIEALNMAIEALNMQAEMMDNVTLLVKHEGWEDVERIFLTDEAGLFGMYFFVAEQMVNGD